MRRIREVIGIRLVKHFIGKSEIVNRMDGNYIIDKIVAEVQNVKIRILIRKNIFANFIEYRVVKHMEQV